MEVGGSNPSNVAGKLSYPIEDYTPPSVNSKHDLRQSFSWDSLLSESGFVAAPVAAFRHVRFIFFCF